MINAYFNLDIPILFHLIIQERGLKIFENFKLLMKYICVFPNHFN